MTTKQHEPGYRYGHRYADGPALDEQVSENVHTMMFRTSYTQTRVANAIHIGQATMSRRMSGESSWLYWEVARLADHFGLSLEEMTTTLPSREEWQPRWNELCACRDSNPKPSDLYPQDHLAIVVDLAAYRATRRQGQTDTNLGLPA